MSSVLCRSVAAPVFPLFFPAPWFRFPANPPHSTRTSAYPRQRRQRDEALLDARGAPQTEAVSRALPATKRPNVQTLSTNAKRKFLSQNRQHFVLPRRDTTSLLLPLFYSSRREVVTTHYITFTPWFSLPFPSPPSARPPADPSLVRYVAHNSRT